MRQSNSLKSDIGYFQSQRDKVPHYGEDVSALAFISRLQVSHLLYKFLLKHNATRIRGSIPSSVLHLVEGGNKDFPQPLR